MAMERPVWTIGFVLAWLLILPGVILTHMSISKLIPPVSDLPSNLVKGFDITFRFAYMEEDAKNIQNASTAVLGMCQVPAALVNATCRAGTYPDPTSPPQQVTVNTAVQKAIIDKAFNDSLSIVRKVTNDKYLGSEQFNGTAEQLNILVREIEKINPTMQCFVAVPVFCAMYQSADAIVVGMGEVTKGIDMFKSSDMVKEWDKRKGVLTFMHALPYILVIGMLFFTLFWFRGGVCCCCRGGTKTGFGLLFYAVFWLVAFVSNAIVAGVGFSLTYGQDQINVPSPPLKVQATLEQVINHLQTTYSDFWDIVFKDMVDALAMLMSASAFFVGACILILLYSLFLCCCCPYRKPEDTKTKESSDARKEDPSACEQSV